MPLIEKISGVLQILENAIENKISGVLQILFLNRIFLNLEYSGSREKKRRMKGVEKRNEIRGAGWPPARGLGSYEPLIRLKAFQEGS